MDYRHISSLDAEERIEKFKKDELTEQVFKKANANLSEVENFLKSKYSNKNSHPIFLVVGLPRSGTTLLTQILASAFEVGYVSNLMARFYQVPMFGAYLQKTVIGDQIKNLSEPTSKHGVTDNIEEPHEFGYFWSKFFSISSDYHEPTESDLEKVPVHQLKNELAGITQVFNKPLMMKCGFGIYFIDVLNKIENVNFIHIKRDMSQVAASVYKTRLERLGSIDKWWSFRPKNYEELLNLPPKEQIVHQLKSFEESLEESLKKVECSRYIEINLGELIEDTDEVLNSLWKWMEKEGRVKKRRKVYPDYELRDSVYDKDLINFFREQF